MSEKLYITLASENTNDFPEMVETLNSSYPNKKWTPKTEVYSFVGDILINGKPETKRHYIQKFETE